jgi:anti-sigma factor RsiW
MMEAWRAADLHAYVDDCLEPGARHAFETQMAQDPALARRAAQWRAQNGAIRAAFDAESARTFSISIVRHQHETIGRTGRPAAVGGKPSSEPLPQPSLRTIVEASRIPAKVIAPSALRRPLVWRLGLAALSLGLACVWAPAAIVVPAKALGDAGVAAFRAFARPGVEPVEFATSDGTQAQAWLTARLTHPVTLPATPSALKLIGARIAPYPGSPAAFLVYKSRDGALGLLIRPLDAPEAGAPKMLAADGRDAAIWTQRGQGFALVGDPDAAALLKIATEFSDPPAEAAQTVPERGW